MIAALALTAVLAQTLTATPAGSSIADLKAQVEAFIVTSLITAATAIVAAAKAYVSARRAKIAQKVTDTVVAGVEGMTRRVETILVAHLGEDGVAALKAQGIDLDALVAGIVATTKKGVQSVAIAAGVEQHLAPVVQRVTSAERSAIDGEGNPIISK